LLALPGSLSLKEQNWLLMMSQTISSEAMVELWWCAGGRRGYMCVGLVEKTGIEGLRCQYNLFAVNVKKERRFKLIFRRARESAEKGLESEKFGFADRGMSA
jgi:hypothetical protein